GLEIAFDGPGKHPKPDSNGVGGGPSSGEAPPGGPTQERDRRDQPPAPGESSGAGPVRNGKTHVFAGLALSASAQALDPVPGGWLISGPSGQPQYVSVAEIVPPVVSLSTPTSVLSKL